MDHTNTSVVAGRYRPTGRSIALGAVVAQHCHDEILDRSVLLIDVTHSIEQIGNKAAVELVLDAARRGSLVSDRRVVKLLDVGRDEDTAYIVSEDPGGVPLSSIDLEHWTPRAVRALLGELSIALEAARGRGVHHQQILSDMVQLTPKGPRLFGLGYLSVLVTGQSTDGDEALAIDAAQLRSLGSSLLTGQARTADPELAEVLSAHDALYSAPASIAAALDPWDAAALTGVLTSSGLGNDESGVFDTASAPSDFTAGATAAGLVRRSTQSRFGPSGAQTPPGTPPPAQPMPGTGPGAAANSVSPRRVSSGVSLGASAASLLSPVLPPSPEGTAAVFAPVGAGAAGGASAAGGAAGVGTGAGSAAGSGAAGSNGAPSGGHTGAGTNTRPAGSGAKGASGVRSSSKRSKGGSLRVGSTMAVLILVVGLVSLAGFWAFRTVGADLGPTHEIVSSRGQSPSNTGGAESDDGETAGPQESFDPPVIASAQQLDPDGDDNEHPEWVDRGFDGDQQTFWATRIYATADFGGYDRRGIGYAVRLEDETQVSTVYLTTESNGGKFELRATSPDEPDGGVLLESGSFEEDMEIPLASPVVTDSIVLWVTELPEISDGFGIRLAEISFS